MDLESSSFEEIGDEAGDSDLELLLENITA
jgi:hypothetical protein